MISPTFSFQRFAEAVQGKDESEVIRLAEKEATVAWRLTYRRDGIIDDDTLKSKAYQDKLIGLIDYMRHNVAPKSWDETEYQLISSIRGNDELGGPIKSA